MYHLTQAKRHMCYLLHLPQSVDVKTGLAEIVAITSYCSRNTSDNLLQLAFLFSRKLC